MHVRRPSCALFLLSIAASTAFANPCDQREIVQRYVTLRHSNAALRWVLALDHVGQTWSLYPVNGTQVGERDADALRVGVDGVPAFERGKDERVLVLVTSTNPVLYSAVALPGEQRELPAMADLKTFAKLAGGALSRALQLAGTSLHETQIRARETMARIEAAPGPRPTPRPQPPDVEALLQYVGRRLAILKQNTGDTEKALKAVVQITDQLQSEGAHAASYLQTLEIGLVPPPGDWLHERGIGELVRKTPARFRNLEATLAALPDAACVEPYTWLRANAAALIDPLAPSEILAATTRFKTMNDRLRAITEAQHGCQPVTLDTAVSRSETDLLRAVAAWMGQWTPGGPPSAADARALLQQMHDGAATYIGAAKTRDSLVEEADKAHDGHAAAMQVAAALLILSEREQIRRVPEMLGACAAGGVVEVPAGPDPYDWDKINLHKFKLVADAPLASKVERAHRDVSDGRYELSPRHKVAFVVGFGGTWTPLSDETYGLVTVEGKDKKYIGRIQEDSMAGRPAVFLTLLPREWLGESAGIDFGAALSTDKPGFFLGGSVKAFRVARIGGGMSWQEVTRLGAGQTFVKYNADRVVDERSLTAITAVEEIRKRKTFRHGGYVNLTFTIPSLPFFKP
jgi:hypothetical protein